MHELDDIALLRQYAEQKSEEAFATLVTRHIDKIYSVALRHTANPHQAEEITQAVFVILARKSSQLSEHVILEGWLYETARLTAMTFIRSEIRRARREQEAYMQNVLNENETEVWPQIAPLLDSGLAGLNETDRHAVVLRFFYGKSMKEIGAALGGSEDTARMRINRALEKLRKFFIKRGIASTTATLAGMISANSVQAAPAVLAKSVTAVALAKGATASSSTLTLIKGALKIMAWTKAKTAIITGAVVLLAVGGGTAIYETQWNLTTSGPAELKGKWMVGKKYELHMELNQSAETKSPDQSQPVKEGLKWTQDFNISVLKELPDGGRQLELEFVNEAMDESQAGRRVLSFDSAQSSAGNKYNRLAILGALVGAHLEYFTDAGGKVQTVEGVNELVNHITAVATPEQQEVFIGMFGGDNLKNYLLFGDWMPNRIMNVGENWSVKKDVVDNIGVLTVNMKLAFKNWEQHGDHTCAHIEETGNISSKSVSTASGAMVKIEKGRISGDIWFDPELGLAVGGNDNEDLILKITTRTQTMTKQTHNKSQWTLVDVQ